MDPYSVEYVSTSVLTCRCLCYRSGRRCSGRIERFVAQDEVESSFGQLGLLLAGAGRPSHCLPRGQCNSAAIKHLVVLFSLLGIGCRRFYV